MSTALVGEPEPIGDVAVAVRIEAESATATFRRVRAVAEAILTAAIPGGTDVVASPGRVSVAYDPLAIDGLESFRAAVASAATAAAAGREAAGVMHEIRVAYDGPDLDEVCGRHGLDRSRFIAAHTDPDYLVEAIGFLPGFGYLAGLPPALALPRRATPRSRVPAGSVGIGGGQTGVYPCASPGGWHLVGHTDEPLFDPRRPRPAVLAVGDHVRFVATADLPPPAPPGRDSAVPTRADLAIRVVAGGLFTTIQDLGRPGHRAGGVPLSGAADSVSLRLANLLVGNPEGAAALECTLVGPTLRFERDAVVACTGGDFPGLPTGAPVRVAAGTVLDLGHAQVGCRGYVAVAGGIDVEPVLGSRSTLASAGMGGGVGRPLAAGDGLALGEPLAPPADQIRVAEAWRSAAPGVRQRRGDRRTSVLRIVPAARPERFARNVWSRSFRTSSRSDRMGVRLDGDTLDAPAAGLPSEAVFPGTVQVPPDGRPIVLLADAQTIGGYPVLGQVIAADLPLAAQLRPGDEVVWRPVTIDEAHAALRGREAALAAVREILS